MDQMNTLPEDVLADILRRLSPCDLAASRCVHRAWLAVVDAHRLLLPHVLTHLVCGLFINYVDYASTRLFVRPTARTKKIDINFLPLHNLGIYTTMDHCNGLLLFSDFSITIRVVNPATRQWEDVAWKDKNANAYLVCDPAAASPHYEVFSIPRVTEKVVSSERDGPHDLMECPPSPWTLNVFSSNTRQWKMRSFIREDDNGVGIMTNVRLDPSVSIHTSWRHQRGPRWRYSAYWKGSLYVHSNDAFVVRLSLSDCKYQLIKAPNHTDKTEHAQFLGKSEKGLYLATVHGTCLLRVWILTESRGRVDWVLKHNIDLEPLSKVWLHDLYCFDKTWTMAEYDVYCYHNYDDDEGEEEEDDDDYDEDDDDYDYDDKKGKEEDVEVEVQVKDEDWVQKENDKMVASEDCEWNSEDDNFLNIDDYDTCSESITFLGFHPYKEVVFLGLPSLVGVAYHLKSSKIQYLGKMRPKDYGKLPTNGIYESFPYTPCMVAELLEHALEHPCGH